MALATVHVDVAPLYEKPSTEVVRLDEALYGMSVQIIQESETGWCYLRTEHHTEGYTPSACLQRDPNVAAAWRKYKKSVVLAPYIDVHKQAGDAAPRAVSLPRGGILVPLAAAGEDGWQKVGLANGSVGYTRGSYLGDVITNWQQLDEDDLRWNLVETALSYNGTAWRGGGRTPLGMDAVGLVAMAYMMNGVVLPREAFEQPSGFLQPVREKDMDEGDIIYFAGALGVYMGDSRYVHATGIPGGEGVTVNSLKPKDDDYRADLAKSIIAVGSLF